MFPPKCIYPIEFTTKYLSSQNGAITSAIGDWFAEGVGEYGNYSTGGIPSPYKIEIGSPFLMCVIYG